MSTVSIYLIESNEVHADQIEQQLAKRVSHFSLRLFDNATDGWNALKYHQPSIIIVDANLLRVIEPSIVTATAKLYQNMPIIILTNKHNEEDKEHFKNLGLNQYWSKSEKELKQLTKFITLNTDETRKSPSFAFMGFF